MANRPVTSTLALTPPLERKYFLFIAATMMAYLVRDALTGVWRWSLNLGGIDPLWFLPDVMGICCVALFAGGIAVDKRSPIAFLVLAMLGASILTALLFVSTDPLYLVAAIKMVMPLVVGWALAGWNVLELGWVRRIILAVLLASIFGLLLAPLIEYPWTGFTVDQFGVAKKVGKVWWIQGQVRFGGLGGESTLSAAMVVFPLILLHRYLSRNVTLLLGALGIWATLIATSRTATAVLSVFLLYFVVIAYLAPAWRSVAAHRTLATASFGLVLVPVLSVGLLQTVDLGEFSSALRSFQERVEISWQYPFTFISGRWPEALFFGCGVGCFTAPMKYTPLGIFGKPVDNFYVISVIMYGWSFVIIAGAMLLSTRMSIDRTKLVLIAALNMYSITVESYSPSIVTLLIAYATSDVFCQGARGYFAARKQRRGLPSAKPRAPAMAMRSPTG